jgi:hypothetical protein
VPIKASQISGSTNEADLDCCCISKFIQAGVPFVLPGDRDIEEVVTDGSIAIAEGDLYAGMP